VKEKGQQLKLFMPASEYKDHIDSSSDRKNVTRGYEEISPNVRRPIVGRETMDEMWARKESEAREPKTNPIHDVQWRGGKGVRVQVGEQHNPTHGAGLYESVKEKGLTQGAPGGSMEINTFVDKTTGEKRQGEGHHRIAAAAAVEKGNGKTIWVRPTYTPANLPKQLS